MMLSLRKTIMTIRSAAIIIATISTVIKLLVFTGFVNKSIKMEYFSYYKSVK